MKGIISNFRNVVERRLCISVVCPKAHVAYAWFLCSSTVVVRKHQRPAGRLQRPLVFRCHFVTSHERFQLLDSHVLRRFNVIALCHRMSRPFFGLYAAHEGGRGTSAVWAIAR